MAKKVRQFLFEEKHQEHLAQGGAPVDALGFWIGGYSAKDRRSELWQIQILNGQCAEPTLVRDQNNCGINWAGQPEALNRMVLGYSGNLPGVLAQQLGMNPQAIGVVMAVLRSNLQAELASAPMPIQDAIDLSRFLVETTIAYTRFCPGAPTVGGPIEIAAVTKHEHFKWVDRKHYFSTILNPEG